MKDCPSGYLVKEEFRRIFQQFFPMGDPTEFSDYIFNIFDVDNSGQVNFKKFICAVSITSRGRLEEKLKCTPFALPFALRAGHSARHFLLRRRVLVPSISWGMIACDTTGGAARQIVNLY
jgi:hypothetical protein